MTGIPKYENQTLSRSTTFTSLYKTHLSKDRCVCCFQSNFGMDNDQ